MNSAIQELSVDLRRQPKDRWKLNAVQIEQSRTLMTTYRSDLGLGVEMAEFLVNTAKELVEPDHWLEMTALAEALNLPNSEIVLCNFYYDAIRVVLGCTAFAVETDEGIFQARNLDWWTNNRQLSQYSTLCRFEGAPAGSFTTIGWPGFIGAFSAIAPGRFAVSLNSVLSLETVQPAMPVVLLLRTVLEEAQSFEEALHRLCNAAIPCDCLLLLTGIRPGELVVIERTPTRYAVRQSDSGFICVTNDYKLLNANAVGPTAYGLFHTSCRRYDRISELMGSRSPKTAEECLAYLTDPQVQMSITVQQMVFNAATGQHAFQYPPPLPSP